MIRKNNNKYLWIHFLLQFQKLKTQTFENQKQIAVLFHFRLQTSAFHWSRWAALRLPVNIHVLSLLCLERTADCMALTDLWHFQTHFSSVLCFLLFFKKFTQRPFYRIHGKGFVLLPHNVFLSCTTWVTQSYYFIIKFYYSVRTLRI